MNKNHEVERVENLMYKGCEPHWHCTHCNNYWPFHCYGRKDLEQMECPARKALKEQGSRGEWIYCEDDSGQDGYRCSGCGFFEPWYYNYTNHDFIKKYQFCPSCGAKMKERTK